MNIQRISAYTIEKDTSKKPLNFLDYSKFKYGHKPTAMKFAQSMVSKFLKTFSLENFFEHGDDVIVSTSPYWCTPPAAHVLATYFHYMLNEQMLKKKQPPLVFLKIHRSKAPVCDFSKLSHKERLENLKTNDLSFDPFMLKGKKLILIEDARITGTHEKKIVEFMEKAGLAELIFVYVIDIGFGATDPDIENRMNHKWVDNLDTINLLMKEPDDFVLNSRLCRFILSWDNKEELSDFCKRINDELLFGLYVSSVNDGYGSIEKYAAGFAVIQQETKIRHQQLLKIDDPVIPLTLTENEK